MATSEELFEQYRGHFVPYKFEAGFVCLSYAVSLIGTGSTLELIRRQTSNRGFHNFLLLTGAAISMGGIAIWSMNYIGNRAISILDGQRELQIAYTTGLTVLSLFIPIIVLFIAFVIISTHGRVCWIRITLSGTISGATFIGMHYLVDASIHNYKASYHAGNIVGAALIAVFANISVLACFFVFESAWTNVWWKRVCSAMLFAGAVSGMQWCAATGTRYRLLHLYRPGDGISRDDSLIAVICLSVGAFVIMIISIIYSHWIKSDYAKKARKVALAAAVFDERGRIMVSQEGLLPSEVITDKFIPTSCNDVFDTSHPVFHWIFWASQNWPKVARVIGAMQSHVAALCSKKFARKVKLKLLGDNGEAVENYNMILCELFCLAALALSSKMKESLETAGSLWDEIFATGDETTQWTRMPSVSDGSSDAASLYKPQSDDMSEKGQSVVSNELGQGSLMFLVRHVNSRRDTERLEAAGYRFAELHHVVGTIRSSMKIKTPDFEEKLRKMSRRSDRNALLSPGAHLGLFAVRARLDYGGFDVLVPKKTKNLLPAVRLQKEHLEAWQQAMVQGFQGLTAPVIVQQLQLGDFESGRERRFAGQLLDSIISLREWVDHPVFDEARFNPQIVQVPCSSLGGASTCSMVAFQLVLPIHFNVTFQNFEVMPLQFFKLRQKLNREHANFASYLSRADNKSPILPFPASGPTCTPQNEGQNNMSLRMLAKPGRPFKETPPYHVSHHTLTKSLHGLSSLAKSRGADSSAKPKNTMDSGDRRIPAAPRQDAPRQGDLSLQPFGSILVSQEVEVNYQKWDDREVAKDTASASDQSSDSTEQGTSYNSTFKPPPEESYTVTATGKRYSSRVGKGDAEGRFVDELLGLCMEKYNPKKP